MSFKSLDLLTIPLEGRNLIEASAGTGKTYTIANLYLRLLLETQTDVRNILVVTFTEAATKELRERIRRNLTLAYSGLDLPIEDETVKSILDQASLMKSPDDIRSRLRKALVSFDEASIFTIHGFCKRLLHDHSFESPLINLPH